MPTPGSARPHPRRTAPHRRRTRRSGAVAAVVAVAAGLLVGFAGPASADPTPPPNPTDAQIGAAQANKTQLAQEVGSLTAQLSQLAVEVQQTNAAAELAEQKYAYAMQQLSDAKTAAAAAKAQVATAQTAVEKAQRAFNASVLANYTQGTVQGGPGALLAATDPETVLQSAAFQKYVTSHQADGIGQLDRAKVAKANADAAARTAVATQTRLTAAAQQSYDDARAAEAAAQSKQASVATQTTAVQAKLDTAQAALLGMQNQRATYNAWRAEQARIAAEKERQRQAAILAAQKAEAARLAALAEQQRQQQQQQNNGNSGGNSGGGSSSGGGGGGGTTTGNPSGGSWTPAMGQAAVNRAMNWLGTPYAFAGGNRSGPTYGVCQSGAAWNDCHVYGFDCSGLALYAWAPFQYMPHYTVAMWQQMAGNYHPSTNDLMPGDLLFYGYSPGTIHHVAIYIGNGNVIQAPQSGDHVRITALWNMGSDYYGAIRPLT